MPLTAAERSTTAEHEAVLAAQTALIERLGPTGLPAANGKIGVVLIGYSNVEQLGVPLVVQKWPALPNRAPGVVLVNGGKNTAPANTLEVIQDPANVYWTTTLPGKIGGAGVAALQVQCVLINECVLNPMPRADLAQLWIKVLGIVKARYPNCRAAFLTPIGYCAYCNTVPQEPDAHDQGFAIADVVAAQAAGECGMELDKVPAVKFGAYYWADGEANGWPCSHYNPDGRHFTVAGANYAADHFIAWMQAEPLFSGFAFV